MTLPPAPATSVLPRADRRVRLALGVAVALAVVAVVLQGAAALTALAAATAALLTAAGLRLRTAWTAAAPAASRPGPVRPPAPESVEDDGLAEQLRALHDTHVEEVNLALAEGREDLARASADRYADEALSLIAGAGRPAA
jgi:hypothetical protein